VQTEQRWLAARSCQQWTHPEGCLYPILSLPPSLPPSPPPPPTCCFPPCAQPTQPSHAARAPTHPRTSCLRPTAGNWPDSVTQACAASLTPSYEGRRLTRHLGPCAHQATVQRWRRAAPQYRPKGQSARRVGLGRQAACEAGCVCWADAGSSMPDACLWLSAWL
jgi:hypothetical protein